MGESVAYRDVVRVLGGARASVLGRFRAGGGDPDRWQRRDREAMADSLPRVEDELELSRGSRAAETRVALRTVRRRLEGDG